MAKKIEEHREYNIGAVFGFLTQNHSRSEKVASNSQIPYVMFVLHHIKN